MCISCLRRVGTWATISPILGVGDTSILGVVGYVCFPFLNFGGKISGKLKNTLGLYVSMGIYSTECTNVDSPGIKSMILMDGADLFAVLDNRITLSDLLYRKRRHASRTGEIYLKVDKILS